MKRNFLLTRFIVMLLCLMLTGIIAGCENNGYEDRDCVVIIGDSIFALYDNIVPVLEDLSGFSPRRYDITGSEMQGGMIPTSNIVSQFKRATNQGHVRTLIMDGGGNDFIISGAMSNARKQVRDGYEEIFRLAAQHGVENIVVMGYYKTSTTTALTDASEQDVRDLTLGLARDLGMNAVHFDPSDDPWFANKMPMQYINATDPTRVHPSAAAGKQLANMIWDIMVENDIEQDGGCY